MFIVWYFVLLMVSTVNSAPVESDFLIAKTWLRAWQSKDSVDLAAKTALPFAFGTTNRIKSCEGLNQTVAALDKWAKCTKKSENLLKEELDRSADIIQDSKNSESKQFKALVNSVPLHGIWVRAFLNGDGITYSFRFLITTNKSGVRQVAAFLIDHDFDRG